MNGPHAFQPRILERSGGSLDLLIQAAADTFPVIKQYAAHFFDAEPFDEVVSALHVLGIFAVVLNEAADVLEHLLVRLNRAQDIALSDARSSCSTDINLPATAFDRDDSDVLDHGLRAIARTARCRHLDLVWRFHTLEILFDLDTEGRAVANSVSTEFFTQACLHRAHGLRVSVPRRYTQVAPDRRQLFLSDSHQIDALAPGDFDHRHIVLLGNVSDCSQFLRRGDTPVNARDDAEGAVLLKVGVDSVIDEPGVPLVHIILTPDRAQQ